MILTNCAACAAPLAHDAPRCVRCKLRYCNKTCQHDHWRRGHKQMCKKIHRGGNAEQYHANKKYKEAVAVAVEACADAASLIRAKRHKDVKTLLRKTILISRRVVGEENTLTLGMRCFYAQSIYRDNRATLDDLHEAVTTLEKIERIARRVLGGSHPIAVRIDECLRQSRATLHVREVISK